MTETQVLSEPGSSVTFQSGIHWRSSKTIITAERFNNNEKGEPPTQVLVNVHQREGDSWPSSGITEPDEVFRVPFTRAGEKSINDTLKEWDIDDRIRFEPGSGGY